MDEFKEEITDFLKKETKIENIELEVPPNTEMGDYAFPCFVLAKEFKKNPVEIAKDLALKIKPGKHISQIKAEIDFFLRHLLM